MIDIRGIRARVQISGRPQPHITPQLWTKEQIYKIARRSPVFERQIHRLLIYERYIWHIDPREEDGFDALTACSLLDNLGLVNEVGNLTEVDELGTLTRLDEFSAYCSALWYFQVVPSRLHVEWQATGTRVGAITQNIPRKPLPSPARARVSGESKYLSPKILAGHSDGWCWNCELNHPSRETSLKLANIALVVGRADVFATEIKTVIWNWNWSEETLAVTRTPVERLQNTGVEGLDNRKKEEMRLVIVWFDDYIAGLPKPPKELENVRNTFIRPHLNINALPSVSIYEWIKALQSQLSSTLGTVHAGQKHIRQGSQSTLSGTSQDAKNNSNRGVWKTDMSSTFQQLAFNKSHPPSHKKIVEEMFQAAHLFIETRQRVVAEELMTWRDAQVQEWGKSLLTDRELPPEMPNEAPALNDGTHTQERDSSSRDNSSERAVVSPV